MRHKFACIAIAGVAVVGLGLSTQATAQTIGPYCFQQGAISTRCRSAEICVLVFTPTGAGAPNDIIGTAAETLVPFVGRQVVIGKQTAFSGSSGVNIYVRHISALPTLPAGVTLGLGCLTDLKAGEFGGSDRRVMALSSDGTVVVGEDVGVDSQYAKTGHGWRQAGGVTTDLGTLGVLARRRWQSRRMAASSLAKPMKSTTRAVIAATSARSRFAMLVASCSGSAS